LTLESITALKGVRTSTSDTAVLPVDAFYGGWSSFTAGGATGYWTPLLTWGTDVTTKSFRIQVPVGTAQDVYSMTARVIGMDSTGAENNSGSEQVYLNVDAAVPEPSTIALVLMGCGGLAWAFWRRRKA
jgi:hypothetical protein